MTRGIIVAAAAASLVITACGVPPQKGATTPPPPPNALPMLPGEVAPPKTRVFRFDATAELAIPRGDLADVQGTAKAVRLGWFGANLTRNLGLGMSTRFVLTEPNVDESLLFFDLIGLYLRLTIPVVPKIKGFLEFEPSMVGMHVDCGRATCTLPNDEGNEFMLRAGLTGRAGGVYELVPGRLDLVGQVSLEQTLPDEGGWLSIGIGLTIHAGPTHAEMKRRQQWQRQQLLQQGK